MNHSATLNVSPYPGPVDAAAEDPGIGEIFRALRRRAGVLCAVVAGVMLLAGAFVALVTPRYQAEVLLMIESEGAKRFVSLESVVAGLSGDEESVNSEAHVLESRAMADRVIQRLGLDSDAEFAAEDVSSAAAYSAVIENYLDHLRIVPLENSRVLAVRFSSENPDKAALIANTIADEYLKARLETKFEITRRANTWLGERIEELRGKVADAESEVERMRAELGLLEGGGLTLASQELIELNTQLVAARTATAAAEVRLRQVQRAARSRAGAATTIEVLQSPLIQRLREQEAEVERRVAELSSELGDKHPRMIQLRAEAGDLRQRIDLEVQKIIAGLRNQLQIARASEQSIEASLEALKARATVTNQNEIGLRALERDAQANRALLDTLLLRQKETMSQEDPDFQQPDATIVSPAGVPAEPAFPRTGLVLGLAFIAALFIGLVIVLLLELLDGGFRSGEQFEQVTGAPSIGFVPQITKPEEYQSLPSYLASKPASALGESMRTLNWSLKLAFPDRPPTTVLISSALPGEGKTTIASCLATAEHNGGRKVVLIDADIRRPSCHELMNVALEPGLTNLLAGDATLDEVLQASKWCGVSVIAAGTPSAQAPNLLGSQRMRDLLAELGEQFELVAIDSAPLLAAADARILASVADATVLVTRWGSTRRQVARLAVRQLQSVDARLAGGLLSMVDVKRNVNYSYADSGTYGGDLAKYYAG